jgi:nitrous oxide reductase
MVISKAPPQVQRPKTPKTQHLQNPQKPNNSNVANSKHRMPQMTSLNITVTNIIIDEFHP